MSEIEKYYADHADEIERDLLGRYALAWASRPVQKVARSIERLDLLAAVGMAQRLQRNKKTKLNERFQRG